MITEETIVRRWRLLSPEQVPALGPEHVVHIVDGAGSLCGRGSVSRINFRVRRWWHATCPACDAMQHAGAREGEA